MKPRASRVGVDSRAGPGVASAYLLVGPHTPAGRLSTVSRGARVRSFIEARETIFVLEVFYLAALLTAAATYVDGIYSLPGSFGTVPLAVPWFGALGGVIISLTGTVEHVKTWDRGFAYWHISRPLIGASVAIVAVLVLQAGLTAVKPGATGTIAAPGSPHNVLYYVVAFAVGYRESTFRELLKRIIDLILAPGPAKTSQASVTSLSPQTGPLAGGTHVDITGTGLGGVHSVTVGGLNATIGSSADTHVSIVTPAATTTGPAAVTLGTPSGKTSAPEFTYT